ncbi:MAG: TldD/PmbA family protein, partial [Candidatus Thorarchaeota archaeon]
RVALNNRVGFASSSGVSAERIKLSIKEAYEVVSSVDVLDERFKSLPDPKPLGKEAEFDEKILDLGIDTLIKDCQDIVADAASVSEKIHFVGSLATTAWGGYAVANSRGLIGATRYGNSGCSVNVQAKENEERRGGFEFDYACHRLYQKEGLGQKASELALSLLGAKKFEVTEKMKTVWTPFSAATYILASVAQSTLGSPVVEGISPLCDMIGDTVGPSFLNIVDDGQAKHGLGTNAIDGEGLPQRRNPVIEKGILKSFLFDSYFGAAFGVDSTGNCDRTGGVFGGGAAYENSPGVSTKFLEVSPGKNSLDDMIASIDGKAIMIFDFPIGIFHGSVATGEFSAVAASAFLIENGEKKYPIEPVSVAGNFYEGLKNLVEVGSDLTSIPYGIANPSLVFDGFSVTNQ